MSEWRSRIFVIARGLLAFALLGYVLWLLVAQLDQTDTTIPTPSPGWLALGTIVMGVYYFLIVENWRVSMGALGAPLGRGHAFYLIYVSNLAKFLPGGLWNFVGRVALSARHGISPTSASASVLLEVIGFTCAMATLSLVTLSSRIEDLVQINRWLLLLVAFAMISSVHPRLLNLALGLAQRFSKKPLPRVTVSYGFMLLLVLRYVLAWFLVALGFVLLVQALSSQPMSFALALFIAGALSISWLAGLLTIIVPAGLGVREVMLTTLLATQMATPIAAAAALAFRLYLIVFDLLLFTIASVLRRRATNSLD